MNGYRDDDELLRSWVDEGVDVAPVQAVQMAMQRIATTRQRRELALLRRIGVMDHARQRTGQAAWRGAFGAVGAIGVMAILLVVAGAVVPRFWNTGSEVTPASAVERVVAAATSAQPAGTVRRTTGPTIEEILPFFIDSRDAREIRTMSGVVADAAIGFQGAEDSRRYLVATTVFADQDQAAAGFFTLANAFRDSRSPTWMSWGSWYVAPDSWADGRGDEAKYFLGPASVTTQGSPGQALVWRTGRAVVVVVGVADELSQSSEVDSEFTRIADSVQTELDRLMR